MGDYAEDEEQQRLLIEGAITAAAFVLYDVWRRYFETGGHADKFELEAYLNGLLPLPMEECNLLAHAVNELIDEEPPLPRAPYRHPPEALTTADTPSTFQQVRQWLWGVPSSPSDCDT
ncbi:hypothetical protein ACX80U_11395 [Arthrobacter sp. TmT3-37]